MQKLIIGTIVAAAFALSVSAGQACDVHSTHVTASVENKEGVAMSTYDGATAPVIVEEAAEPAAASPCPEGATDCAPTPSE
jgi:hypothetical protein